MADHVRLVLDKSQFESLHESLEAEAHLTTSLSWTGVGVMAGEGRKKIARKEAQLFHNFSRKWTRYTKNGPHQEQTVYNAKQGYMYHGKNQFGNTGLTPMIMYSWERSKAVRRDGKLYYPLMRASLTSQLANLYEKGYTTSNRTPLINYAGSGRRKWRAPRRVEGKNYFLSQGGQMVASEKATAYAAMVKKWQDGQARIKA